MTYYISPDPASGDLQCLDNSPSTVCDQNDTTRTRIEGLTYDGTQDFTVDELSDINDPTSYNKGTGGTEDPTIYLQSYEVNEVNIGSNIETHVIIADWDGMPDGLGGFVPGTGGVSRPHVVYVNGRLQVNEGSSLNCGDNGTVPGNPEDLIIVVDADASFQLDANTCIAGYIYLHSILKDDGTVDVSNVLQIGQGAVIYGAVNVSKFATIDSDIEFHYTPLPNRSIPEICDGTDYDWDMVTIPSEGDLTVQQVFQEELGAANYNTSGDLGWRVFERILHTGDNSSHYNPMALSDPMYHGQAYWLRSDTYIALDRSLWDTNDTDSNFDGVPDYPDAIDDIVHADGEARCVDTTKNSGCIDYLLTLPHSTCTTDSSGPFRNIMVGNPARGVTDWANYRFYGVEATLEHNMTPSQAEAIGWFTKQIWKYNKATGDYDTCDDSIVDDCLIESKEGFWTQVRCQATTDDLSSPILTIPNNQE